MPIELVRGVAKNCVAAANGGVTWSMAATYAALRQALYTAELAQQGVSLHKGGDFAPRADGTCPAAAAIFTHVLRTPGKGVQAMIDADARLGGTVDDLTAPQEWVEASASFVRCVLHHNLQQLLAGEHDGGELEGAIGELDEPGDGDEGV
jgi:hypothetical protein